MATTELPSSLHAQRQSGSYRWIVLLLALLIQIAVSMVQQATSALAPILTHELGFTRSQIGLLYGASYLGMALATVPIGIMIDRRGERSIVLVGVAVMGVLTLAMAGATTFVWFFVILVLTGIGGATSSPGGSKALSTWFRPRQWGLAMGIRQTGVTIGGLIGALALPVIAVHFNWHVSIVAVGVFALLSLAGFAAFYHEVPTHPSERLPIPFAALLRNGPLLAIGAYAFIANGAQGCAVSYIALFAHQSVGVSTTAAGIFLALVQVGGITGRIGWGVVSDRLGLRGPVIAFISTVAALTFLALAFVGSSTPLFVLAIFAVILGLTAVAWNGLFFTIVAEITGSEGAATGISLSLIGAYLGPVIIPPIFGLLADRTGNYHDSWMAAAAWTVIAVLIALWVTRRERAKLKAVDRSAEAASPG